MIIIRAIKIISTIINTISSSLARPFFIRKIIRKRVYKVIAPTYVKSFKIRSTLSDCYGSWKGMQHMFAVSTSVP